MKISWNHYDLLASTSGYAIDWVLNLVINHRQTAVASRSWNWFSGYYVCMPVEMRVTLIVRNFPFFWNKPLMFAFFTSSMNNLWVWDTSFILTSYSLQYSGRAAPGAHHFSCVQSFFIPSAPCLQVTFPQKGDISKQFACIHISSCSDFCNDFIVALFDCVDRYIQACIVYLWKDK